MQQLYSAFRARKKFAARVHNEETDSVSGCTRLRHRGWRIFDRRRRQAARLHHRATAAANSRWLPSGLFSSRTESENWVPGANCTRQRRRSTAGHSHHRGGSPPSAGDSFHDCTRSVGRAASSRHGFADWLESGDAFRGHSRWSCCCVEHNCTQPVLTWESSVLCDVNK